MITKLLISLSLILTFQSLTHAQSDTSEVLIDNGDASINGYTHYKRNRYKCAVIKKEEKRDDGSREAGIYMRITDEAGRRHWIQKLFSIDEKTGQYYVQERSVAWANRQSDSDLTFSATDNRLHITNGNKCNNRIRRDIRLRNGDLTDIRSITEKNGTCGLVRYALAVPAAIYGAAVPGNTFRCKF